jgi:DNA-binding MarR family transcriptional regulator
MRKPYYSLESLEPDNSVGYLLKRCGLLVTQVAERRFQSLPITFSQWVVLIHLERKQHVSATQLSASLGHDMGALTRVVDELERSGFARRERSRRDRRAVEIAITPTGRREARNGKRVVVELLNRFTEPLTHREIDTLLVFLRRLQGRLQEALTVGTQAVSTPAPAAPGRGRRARGQAVHGGAA